MNQIHFNRAEGLWKLNVWRLRPAETRCHFFFFFMWNVNEKFSAQLLPETFSIISSRKIQCNNTGAVVFAKLIFTIMKKQFVGSVWWHMLTYRDCLIYRVSSPLLPIILFFLLTVISPSQISPTRWIPLTRQTLTSSTEVLINLTAHLWILSTSCQV